MARASATDLEQAFALVHEWHQADSADELTSLATTGLRHLVPCDAVGWNDIDLAGGSSQFVLDPADYFTELMVETLTRLLHEHPLVGHLARTGNGSAVAISDFLTVRAYHRRELYCDLYRPLGVEDQLAFAFATKPGGGLTGVAFNRAKRNFTTRDRVILDLLRPHLGFCYENLRARATARERLEALERGLEEEGHAVVVLNGGSVQIVSRTALQLLSRWFDGGPPPLPFVGHPLVFEGEQIRLTVRRVVGDPPLLLLDETRFAPDPECARALGLSQRETEVLTIAAHGMTDAAIAEQLFVSARTVQKHLEHAYLKLGVNTRGQATARLLGK